MTKKKKRDRFDAVKEVKTMARERIGNPPTSRVVPDRKKKEKRTEKHPKTLGELLEERDQNG
jgi:hypothetical protein